MAKKKPSSPTLAQILFDLRQKAGYESAYALAQAAGVPRSSLARIEAGGDPTWSTLLRLTRALGVSLAVFDPLVPVTEGACKK